MQIDRIVAWFKRNFGEEPVVVEAPVPAPVIVIPKHHLAKATKRKPAAKIAPKRQK